MRVAFVGCGFVADLYAKTLANHPQLELCGVHDRDQERGAGFQRRWKVPRLYGSLQELLDDTGVQLVANLTNPAAHYEITRACLLAGKHVYSEKPLATSLEHAGELVRLAGEHGLYLSGAPCSVLGEAAQTVWKALRDGLPGKVRLVYAELEDGLYRHHHHRWRSPEGLPWPHVDEFETGIAWEHAGYHLTWLAAFFGPARRITAFASCQAPDKDPAVEAGRMGPDVTVCCIEFASGVVARCSCGSVADQDHFLRIFGDVGVLSCKDVWKYTSPVYFENRVKPDSILSPLLQRSKILNLAWTRIARKLKPVRKADFEAYAMVHHMDVARGIAEMADAVSESRPCRISAHFLLHVTEMVLAMQPPQGAAVRELTTTFEPMAPMPWAG